MFYDQSGEVLKSVWGDASKKDENTDWVRQVRIFPVSEGSGIVRVLITFFFASEGENHLDKVELLKF